MFLIGKSVLFSSSLLIFTKNISGDIMSLLNTIDLYVVIENNKLVLIETGLFSIYSNQRKHAFITLLLSS